MALTRWERFGGDLPDRWRRWFEYGPESEGWLRVEELHEDGTLIVRAELPGVDPEKDVDVSVRDGVLHISAKREERNEHKDKGNYRSEFRYGSFSREFPLPNAVDKEAVKATYKDGILEVRVPWASEPDGPSTKVPIARS
jgi:HSP20 family protein